MLQHKLHGIKSLTSRTFIYKIWIYKGACWLISRLKYFFQPQYKIKCLQGLFLYINLKTVEKTSFPPKFPQSHVLHFDKGQYTFSLIGKVLVRMTLYLNDSMHTQQKTLHTGSSSPCITQWQACIFVKANGISSVATK